MLRLNFAWNCLCVSRKFISHRATGAWITSPVRQKCSRFEMTHLCIEAKSTAMQTVTKWKVWCGSTTFPLRSNVPLYQVWRVQPVHLIPKINDITVFWEPLEGILCREIFLCGLSLEALKKQEFLWAGDTHLGYVPAKAILCHPGIKC